MRVLLAVLTVGILCAGLYLAIGPGDRLREKGDTLAQDSRAQSGDLQKEDASLATDGEVTEDPVIARSEGETERKGDRAAIVEADSEPATAATGMDSTGPSSEGQLPSSQLRVRGKGDSRVGSIIRGVIEDLEASGMSRATAQPGQFRSYSVDGLIRLDAEGNIQTYIYTQGTIEEAREALEALGARIEIVNEEWGIVQAWLPFDAVDRVAELELVKRIETPDYGFTRAGEVTTEGDAILRADQVREVFGLTGAGIKVGAISDGVESRTSAQASGDLPASIEINPELPGGRGFWIGDEGTAILEIIHDMAPGASLAFSGPSTSLEMTQSIHWLAHSAFGGSGVDIIVDDLGFFGEPFFEDGPIALKVKEVVEGGTVYLTAAGNSSEEHYEGDFTDDGNGFHDFGGGDLSMRVTLRRYGAVFLQWNDKFRSSGNDYDLYGCREGVIPSQSAIDEKDCIASTTLQDGDDNPREQLLNRATYDRTWDLYIKKTSGSARRLEMHFIRAKVHEHNVPEGSVFGHPAVTGALAVGAINADDSGHDSIAPYSSRGPSEIYFPTRETRPKPDVVAIDGVSVTGAGDFPSIFYGTSAAAPHAAAVAALALEAIRGDRTTITRADAAQQVFEALRETAVDLGSAGFDNNYGAGRVDALLALGGGDDVVFFERSAYTVVEGVYAREVEVRWTAARKEDVAIPIVVTNSGAVSSDYTLEGLEGSEPNYSLRIPANALSAYFTFRANADPEDEDGESVTLRIGGPLPAGVNAGIRTETTVSLLDRADAPGICGRVKAVRQAILSVIPGKVDCVDVTPEELASITHLDLSGEGITEYSGIDFQGLPNLREMSLGGSQLATLPVGVFAGLTDLEELSLRDSQLTALPAGVFAGLTNLRQLNLIRNPLTTLPARVFEGLSSLQELNLVNNPLTTLPVGVFEGLTNLQELVLRESQLTTLSAGVFAELTNLRRLFLIHNQLTALPSGLFAGMSNLEELGLFQNQLTDVPENLLNDLTNLRGLDLSDNQLTTLPAGFLQGLSKLEWFWAIRNQLTVLPAGLFQGLSNLRALNLFSNQLTALPEGLFDGLSNLEWIQLDQNQLTTLPPGLFEGLSSLIDLNLYGNPLKTLPAGAFKGLTSLPDLILNGYELTTLSVGVFEGLSSIEELNLANNQFQELPAGLFEDLPNLQSLVLSNNQLTTLPEGLFEGLSKLHGLSVTDNPLTVLPAGLFEGLHALGRLWLHDNQLTSLPEHLFEGLSDLYLLDLRGNQLTTLLAGSFEGLSDLRFLQLHSNQLTTLPVGLFEGLSSLKKLSLKDNPLTSLPAGLFEGLSSLESLTLGGHAFTSLPVGVFEGLTNLPALSLKGNALTDLPAGVFGGLTNLTELSLEENELTTLPVGVFESLTKLRELRLNDNQLTTIPKGVFEGMANTRELYLNNNQLTTFVVGTFEGLTDLRELYLNNNQLTSLSQGVFVSLAKLGVLHLGANQLATLPASAFEGLTNLSKLHLNDNQLIALPAGVFEGLSGVGRLWLNGNQLMTLSEEVFQGLSGLHDLYLNGNQLTSLSAGVFKQLIDMRDLDLRDNQLTTLPAGMFDGLKTLDDLYLDGNPGAPFRVNVELERVGTGHYGGTVQVRARMAEGTPFLTSAYWTATGELICCTTGTGEAVGGATGRVHLPAGSRLSETFEVESLNTRGRLSLSLSEPLVRGTFNGLVFAPGDPLTLDLAMIPGIGEQIGAKEEILGIPTGDWAPDFLLRASFSLVDGESTITFEHGGRIDEDGITYTCLSSEGCTIEDTLVKTGTVIVSETADDSELMLAGLAEFVDDKTVFLEETYNGYELKGSTVTTRSVAGETTRVSFIDLDGDLVFADFSSGDPATEMIVNLEEYSGTLEASPYNQPDAQYARGLATIWIMNPTEHTWLSVVSLGNHIDRVDLALVKDDTFAGAVNGMADIRAIHIEGDGSIGAIDAANANFVGSSDEIGIDAAGTVVRRALTIGDLAPSEAARPLLRISGNSLNPANVGQGESVVAEIRIAGGDLAEATGDRQIDTAEVRYQFPIVAEDGELSIRDSNLRPDLGDGHLPAVTDTFVANPNSYFVTDGQTTGIGDTAD